MKKLFASLSISSLLLTSCSASSTIIAGEVISCAQINSDKNSIGGTKLDCLDGSAGVSVQSLRGPMIVNVWGSWCVPCKEEMPIFRSFFEKTKGKIELIGIDVEEAKIEDGQNFVKENGMTWPNLYDAKGVTRRDFGMGVPVTWFIAPDGTVAYKKIGAFKNEIELIQLTSKYLGVKL